MDISVKVRAAVALCRHELIDIGQFCTHTDAYWKERLQEFKNEFKDRRLHDEADEMFIQDRFLELKHHGNQNAYFGILMVFSALERFLQSIHDTTVDFATLSELKEALLRTQQRRLALESFKSFLKALDVDLSKPPDRWHELLRLQHYRNAIAHQGGLVTEVNQKALAAYHHKAGEPLQISLKYVHRSIQLVQRTTDKLGEDYLAALRKKGLL